MILAMIVQGFFLCPVESPNFRQYRCREGRDYFVILRPGCFVASLALHDALTNVPTPDHLQSSFSSKSSLSVFFFHYPSWFPGLVSIVTIATIAPIFLPFREI